MDSPFSPFINRRRKLTDYKRRQSQLPSDLIDWDAPEIPELEKQRIIYEQIIQETNEEHAIETLISEEIFQVANEIMIEETRKQYESRSLTDRSQINLLLGQVKMFEEHCKELENNNKELEDQSRDTKTQMQALETKYNQLMDQYSTLEAQKQQELDSKNQELEKDLEKWMDNYSQLERDMEDFKVQYKDLQAQLEAQKKRYNQLEEEYREFEDFHKDFEFEKQELEAENSCQLDSLIAKASEAEDLKLKLEGALCRLGYYKKIATVASK